MDICTLIVQSEKFTCRNQDVIVVSWIQFRYISERIKTNDYVTILHSYRWSDSCATAVEVHCFFSGVVPLRNSIPHPNADLGGITKALPYEQSNGVSTQRKLFASQECNSDDSGLRSSVIPNQNQAKTVASIVARVVPFDLADRIDLMPNHLPTRVRREFRILTKFLVIGAPGEIATTVWLLD